MTPGLALTVLVALAPSASSAHRALVVAALDEARTSLSLSVELLALEKLEAFTSGVCAAKDVAVLAPVAASGRVPVRIEGVNGDGAPCGAAGFARIQVTAPAVQLANATARGADIGAVQTIRAEVRDGTLLAALPKGARATRPLLRGAVLRVNDIEHGPRLGELVSVIVRTSAIEIEESGRIAGCPGGRSRTDAVCATLRGGRRVSGQLDAQGALVVEVRR